MIISRSRKEKYVNTQGQFATNKTTDIRAYIAIARPDHWFKNVFMLFGLMLALFLDPSLVRGEWYRIFLSEAIKSAFYYSGF